MARGAQCKVIIGGKDLVLGTGVVSVVVKRALNRIPLAEVVIYDGSPSEGKFPLSTEEKYLPGTSLVTIQFGNEDEGMKLTTVFTGIIIGQSIKAPLNAPATLKLELRDPMIAATVIRKNRYFKDLDDSNIAFQIVNEYPDVKFDDFDGGATHKEMVQYNCTDWDFLLSRAEANGFFVYFNQKETNSEIKIGPPVFAPGNEIIQYGRNLIELEANISARDQYVGVTSQYWKYGEQAMKSEEATGEDGDIQGSIKSTDLAAVLGKKPFHQQTFGKLEDRELKDWSDAKSMRSKLSKVQGRVRIYGNNRINPGDVIKLEGVGTTYGPLAYVSEVMHSMSEANTWVTDIKFGYDDDWFYERHNNIMDKSAAGLIPGIQGLCCAKVKDIVDPDGQYRVKVALPFVNVTANGQELNADGVWARMVSADAGGGKRGMVIRPEVGDEVIVGFLNNDPRFPVILGTVFSSTQNKVPTELDIAEENNLKGWVTRAGTKFLINDEEKKESIMIETPGGNIVFIDDDKKSVTITNKYSSSKSNVITMDDKGITLKSGKDIILDASEKVTVTGKQNVTIESKSGKLTAKGSTGAEVTTSGKAVLKGSIVNIN